MNNILKYTKLLLDLMKYKVSLAVTFTSVCGYLLYSGNFTFHILGLISGIFLLSGGASALNQYQERFYDKLMDRTKNRPIPSGRIPSQKGILYSFILIINGLMILLFYSGITSAILGIFNVFWYNMLYTNLKRKTPYAVIPGALTGAVPVLIGWSAAGGNIYKPEIIFICFALFIWQIPHFWLLMLKYSEDYKKAGFPVINNVFNHQNLRLLIFVWIVATSVTTLMLPLFFNSVSTWLYSVLLILNIWLIYTFTRLTFRQSITIEYKKAFITINIFMFFFLSIILIEIFIF